jgi:hypothetical protein
MLKRIVAVIPARGSLVKASATMIDCYASFQDDKECHYAQWILIIVNFEHGKMFPSHQSLFLEKRFYGSNLSVQAGHFQYVYIRLHINNA